MHHLLDIFALFVVFFSFLLYESRLRRLSLNFPSLVFYLSEKVIVSNCIFTFNLKCTTRATFPAVGYRRFHFFVSLYLVTKIAFFYSNSIQNLKIFIPLDWTNLRAIFKLFSRRKSLLYFFFLALLTSSSILLSLFDTQIMNCLERHKNLSLF